jgi:hypothetical protein
MRRMRIALFLMLVACSRPAARGAAPGADSPPAQARAEQGAEAPASEEAAAGEDPAGDADAGTESAALDAGAAATTTAPPPWAGEPLAAGDVPRVYLDEHGKADNRATCPLLVATDVEAGAKPRRASFHGGWAVAYDKKGAPGTRPSGEPCASCGRSAFGVAGAGVEKGGGPRWPKEIVWSDGSRAGYGPEGGQGPQLVAFLERADAGCLYNIWSSLGEQHLVNLIHSLRRVHEE